MNRARTRRTAALRGFRPAHGHTLVELTVVLFILLMCAATGAVSIVEAIRATETRSSAQAWQAAAAAAQSRALWAGRLSRVTADTSGLSLTAHVSGAEERSLDLGLLAVTPFANVTRWRTATGTDVTFAAGSASPDSGGSLLFGDAGRLLRVVVRVESGLTARSMP